MDTSHTVMTRLRFGNVIALYRNILLYNVLNGRCVITEYVTLNNANLNASFYRTQHDTQTIEKMSQSFPQ